MRHDEGGCADLRRSLTARTKPVRRLIYAPPRRRCPRPGATVVRGCARGVSVALAPEGRYLTQRAARPRRYRAPCLRRQPTRPRRPDTVRSPRTRPPSPCRSPGHGLDPDPYRHALSAGPADLGRNRLVALDRCSQRTTFAHRLISSDRLRPRPLRRPLPAKRMTMVRLQVAGM